MVICDYNQHPAIEDVVFVIEDTAALATNFPDLLNNYLVKTLEHFNKGPHTIVERAWASIECSSTFSLVLFKSADWRPERLTSYRGPFTSAKRLFTNLEKISFVGGQGETKSCAADGLANALQIFDDLERKRKDYLKDNHNVSQYIIYVGNSQAYEMPVQDVPKYIGQSVDDIIKKMTEKSIYFSVISPRKIPQLIRLFKMAGGDVQKHKDRINYAKDGTQLVLLNGFELPTQPFIPKSASIANSQQDQQQQQQQIPQPAQQQPAQQQPQMVQAQQPSQMQQQQQQQNTIPVSQPQQQQQQMQPQMIPQPGMRPQQGFAPQQPTDRRAHV